MGKLLVPLVAALLIVLLGAQTAKFLNGQHQLKAETKKAVQVHASSVSQSPTNATNKPLVVSSRKISLFFIALDDNGSSGQKIGCEDSVVAVEYDLKDNSTPLKSAISKLLANHSKYYGQHKLYNSLYQSRLQLVKGTISNGNAELYLSGTISKGGICDSPRIKAQLENTALQFPEVRSVKIFINNISLDQVLSAK